MRGISFSPTSRFAPRVSVILAALIALGSVVGCARTGDAVAIAQVRGAQPDEGAEAPGVAFAQDEGGRLARDRLTAFRMNLADPPPAATAPRPWRNAKLEQLPALPLAPAEAPAISHAVDSRARSEQHGKDRPAVDVPPLATGQSATLPTFPPMPAGPKVSVAGPDPLELPPLPISARAPEITSPLADPTAEVSRRAAMAAITWLREQAAPFLKLVIPDPFEHRQAARLRETPPEPIEPTSSPIRPTLPAMPAK